jgi:adenylosuccinate lyase
LQHLGLGSMAIPGRTIVDHLTEYVLLLVMCGTTCGKVAREVRELMKVRCVPTPAACRRSWR